MRFDFPGRLNNIKIRSKIEDEFLRWRSRVQRAVTAGKLIESIQS